MRHWVIYSLLAAFLSVAVFGYVGMVLDTHDQMSCFSVIASQTACQYFRLGGGRSVQDALTQVGIYQSFTLAALLATLASAMLAGIGLYRQLKQSQAAGVPGIARRIRERGYAEPTRLCYQSIAARRGQPDLFR